MKSIDVLKELFLKDIEGNRSKVIRVRGVESGIKHLEIWTQSSFEKENGIKTVHKITTSEDIE